MEENKSLKNKYQTISEDTVAENPFSEEKTLKEKKVKEPKQPKEKKVKEPKQPKEKKIKEPKLSKEKKVKEPKEIKEPKKSIFSKKEKLNEENLEENKLDEQKLGEVETVEQPKGEEATQNNEPESVDEQIPLKRRTEEIVIPTVKSEAIILEENPKPKKEKKVKEPKPPKEKKEKEPKPPKEKKEKEPKPPKEKKEKERDPFNKKDFFTIIFSVAAVVLVGFAVKTFFFQTQNPNANPVEPTTVEEKVKLSDIQISTDLVGKNIVQSDIDDVFFGFSESNYELQYYQYKKDKMTPVKATDSLEINVNMGNETIPATIEYIDLSGEIFGMGLFKAEENTEVYFYKMLVFKLVNLPKGYEKEGKALLLATESPNALYQKDVLWTESFVVDLTTGATERFLKITNRTIDMTGAGVDDFCMLNFAGYNSTSGKIPFISARKYATNSDKQDIFIKDGTKEELLVSDIYGKFFLMDGDDIIFARKGTADFDIVRLSGAEETVIKTYPGLMSRDYIITGNYMFHKETGKLYNLLTGEEKLVLGYRISPEMIEVSLDGKYLVILGTVKNIEDYQIHIFNLETDDFEAFEDKNFSKHSNLTFINETTAVYVVIDPNEGYECVAFDVTKAV